jgi:hypothetical protein
MAFMLNLGTAFEAWCFSSIYDIYDRTIYGLMNQHIQLILPYSTLHVPIAKHFLSLHTLIKHATHQSPSKSFVSR